MANRYTEEQRAIALEIVKRHDGILTAGAMDAIRLALNTPDLPDQTVRLWMKSLNKLQSRVKLTAEKNLTTESKLRVEISENVQRDVSQKLDALLERAAHALVEHATQDKTIARSNVQQAMTAAGIAIDKMQLLRGLPTEIVKTLPLITDVFNLLQGNGVNPVTFFQEVRAQLTASNSTKNDTVLQ